MKKLIFLLVIIFSLSFTPHSFTTDRKNISLHPDTTIILHVIDGTVNEWPADKFSTDKETGIQYTADNDTQNLYIAMKISDQGEQMKLMGLGMKFFIDMKGKRKQNLGVEFPVKRETGSSFQSSGMSMRPSGEQGTKTDMKKVRMMLAANLVSLKLFGFTEAQPVEQNLETAGSVVLAYDWDSTDVMQIEYLIPLAMLEKEIVSLDHKLVSLGWKINGIELPPSASFNSNSTSLGGVPNNGIGSRMPPGRTGGSRPGAPTQAEMEKMMKEQEFWTKYTFNIPTVLKGF